MIKTFWDFLNERHRIYIKKERGDPFPWTDDSILQTYSFTNIYRMLDRVSKECKRLVLDKYRRYRRDDAADLVLDVIVFRLFNWPPTWELLNKTLRHGWDEAKAIRVLTEAKDQGEKVFTGAYNVSNNGLKLPKAEIICKAITVACEVVPEIVKKIRAERTIRNATLVIKDLVPNAGLFVAYEFVCDLRWTPLLAKAPDIMTWANAGPGARRGLNRIHGRPFKQGLSQWEALKEMQALLAESQRPGVLGKHMRPLEMRDVEHSLCEWDKYLRTKNGEGKPRSRYTPPAPKKLPVYTSLWELQNSRLAAR